MSVKFTIFTPISLDLGLVVNGLKTNPANTRYSPNDVSMLGQCQRRWSDIETSLGECLVFAGKRVKTSTFMYRLWFDSSTHHFEITLERVTRC